MKKGLNVSVCDELFSENEVESLGLKAMKSEDADNSFQLF
jgi:hypothetical protein